MKLIELRIRRMPYGPDQGKYTGTIQIEGSSATCAVKIAEADAMGILRACADIIGNAATAQVESFRREFLSAIVQEEGAA